MLVLQGMVASMREGAPAGVPGAVYVGDDGLIAEGDKVVGRFRCSGTHEGEWRGQPPTGRRFERIDEVYIFRLRDGRIVHAWGLEDTLARMRQFGLA